MANEYRKIKETSDLIKNTIIKYTDLLLKHTFVG